MGEQGKARRGGPSANHRSEICDRIIRFIFTGLMLSHRFVLFLGTNWSTNASVGNGRQGTDVQHDRCEGMCHLWLEER